MVAALTVLRAYHVAGRPPQATRLGSFGDWSDTVRSALLWLGAADPVETTEQARTADPKLERLQALLLQWKKVIGPEKVSANDVAQRASQRHQASGYDFNKPAAFIHPEFREALLAVAGNGGFIDAVRLGQWLGKTKGRVVSGLKFEPATIVDGIKHWCVMKQEPKRQDIQTRF